MPGAGGKGKWVVTESGPKGNLRAVIILLLDLYCGDMAHLLYENSPKYRLRICTLFYMYVTLQ